MKNQNKVVLKYHVSNNVTSMPNHKPKRIRHTKKDNQVYEEQSTTIYSIITIFFNCLSYLLNGISIILFYRYLLGYDIKNLIIGVVCCIVSSIIKSIK